MARLMSSLLCGFFLLSLSTNSSAEEIWTSYSDSLISNRVLSIAVDDSNIVWYGTKEGIGYYDGTEWGILDTNGIVHGTCYNILVDDENRKWFMIGGIYVLENEILTPFSSLYPEIPPVSGYTSMEIDSTSIFLGTQSEGLLVFNGTEWTQYTQEQGLADNYCQAIAVKGNTIWVANINGVSRFDGVSWTTYSMDDGLLSNDVKAICIDSDGEVWFGGMFGISRFNGATWTTYEYQDLGLDDASEVWIKAICQENDGTLWFGNLGNLAKYNKYTNKWNLYGAGAVSSITIDNENKKWFGTYNGIYCLDDGVTTAIEEQRENPHVISILQNYPNPFNTSTTISYTLPEQAQVSLTIYNITGQQVRRYDPVIQHLGTHEIVFDSADLPSGIYFARIEAGDYAVVTRMLLLR